MWLASRGVGLILVVGVGNVFFCQRDGVAAGGFVLLVGGRCWFP